MSKKLRLGLLGTGIAPRELYLPAFERLHHKLELVACASRHRAKATAYARLAGIPKVVGTAEELFRLPEVEAVLISLPIAEQPRYVLAALRAGKAVLSEKPVAPSVVEGKKLIKAAKRFDAPWLVGENHAFMPHVWRLEQWLRDGRLGTVRLVQATQMTWMDKKSPYFHTAWRSAPKHVGGYVADAGVHLANIVRRCFGTPVVVHNLTARFERSLPPLDTAVAALRFESGALGTWTSCFAARGQAPMLRVYGSKGSAELGWNELTLRDEKGRTSNYVTGKNSFELEFEHFADVVKKGRKPWVLPEDALEDLALMERIVKKR